MLICDEGVNPVIFVSGSTLVTAETENNVDWYFNDELYGSGLSINPSSDGYYYIVVSDELGCSWVSETIFYQSTECGDDLDNDGINDNIDNDVDGDGIVNSEDDDVDGDGIPDEIDNDVDGDGIDNNDDDSISGYLFMDEISPSSILLYPNPSGGLFNLKLLDNSLNSNKARIVVVDLKGHVVYDSYIELQEEVKFDFNFLSPAVYSMKIYVNQTTFSKNIVIQ